jgi:hypothetical protein
MAKGLFIAWISPSDDEGDVNPPVIQWYQAAD